MAATGGWRERNFLGIWDLGFCEILSAGRKKVEGDEGDKNVEERKKTEREKAFSCNVKREKLRLHGNQEILLG